MAFCTSCTLLPPVITAKLSWTTGSRNTCIVTDRTAEFWSPDLFVRIRRTCAIRRVTLVVVQRPPQHPHRGLQVLPWLRNRDWRGEYRLSLKQNIARHR